MGIKTTPTLGSSIHLPLEDGDKPTPTLGSSIHLPLEDGDKPHPTLCTTSLFRIRRTF